MIESHPYPGGRDTSAGTRHRAGDGNARMIVWIWDASGPAASACGVAGTAEAARRADLRAG